MDLDLLDPLAVQAPPVTEPAGPRALVVKSLATYGGQATLRGRKADFVRVVLSGVRLDEDGQWRHAAPSESEAAVLEAEDAEALAFRLRELVNDRVRLSATPAVLARGTWSWQSKAPRADDLVVTEAAAGSNCTLVPDGASMLRLDLGGALMFEAERRDAPVRRRAVFPVFRHVQVLVSSLTKCTQSMRAAREWEDPTQSMTWREVVAPRRVVQPWERRQAYLAPDAAR
ncbi:MAG: hypothetical protein ACRDZ5_00895 [Acidimicrobiales bacterium]